MSTATPAAATGPAHVCPCGLPYTVAPGCPDPRECPACALVRYEADVAGTAIEAAKELRTRAEAAEAKAAQREAIALGDRQERERADGREKLIRGAMRAQDEREQAAGASCGVPYEEWGCDWPAAVAERLVSQRAARKQAEKRGEAAERRAKALEEALGGISKDMLAVHLDKHPWPDMPADMMTRDDWREVGAVVCGYLAERAKRVDALASAAAPGEVRTEGSEK